MAHSSFISEEDFAAAYDQYADVIFRHCYLRVLNRETAKELMTEAFTRVWSFIAEGNYVDSMQLLLYRISNELVEETHANVEAPVQASIDEHADNAPEIGVLSKMSPEDRRVVILHYVDGFSLQEIGSILGGALQDHALALRKGTSFISAQLA